MFTLGDQSLLWIPWFTRTFFEHFCQIKPSKKLLPHCSCFFGTILHQAQCKPLNLSRPGNALLKGINFTYFTNRLEILRPSSQRECMSAGLLRWPSYVPPPEKTSTLAVPLRSHSS
ncbi:uncharacterized protein LACBIDRAFT_335467 [Laccaria bicolor S238N-H82]|uniref:Predicted protein n=1 Tax=Laccaria bicolor (strain S238N-H82 / ATCC MYA-4686) TaxID=486041 RepID=B0E2E3_LACBS|nr:uncharacterized protein LACBIDRAFT_335467 [Laccaria bicolor S238N-H82]EDQ98994.1 predicted protein [Laccaria bicolor S238N-H82]|eukprot:XP_001890355.1 predicted protein [Laccaria bicolor S238N-H82]